MSHEEIHSLAWRIIGGAIFALAWFTVAVVLLSL